MGSRPACSIHNRWKVPGGPLTEADYRKAVEAGGFTGTTIVGTDLATLRLPAKEASLALSAKGTTPH